VAEIARQVAIASGEQPRKKRLNYLGCRVRGCLHFLRTQGIGPPSDLCRHAEQGWVLASRKEEMLLSGAVQPDGRVTNGATVLSILRSSKGPMTAVQIAEALLAISGDPATEINTQRAVYRVRDHLRDFEALGLVRDVRTKGCVGLWVLAEGDSQAQSDQAA